MFSKQKRQQILNLDKYYASEKSKEDLSGKMSWCIDCPKQICYHSCSATQRERDENCLCAENYMKIKKLKK